METFLARYRNITALAAALVAQLLLLGYQIRNDRDVRLIRLWGVATITPAARGLQGGHGFLSGLWNRYVGLYDARRESEHLQAELDRLKMENQSLRNALQTADRLKLLAAYQQSIPSRTLGASVIGAGANPNSRVVFLDKGLGAGLRAGMAVITADGIVGKVQSVFPGVSLVVLISDPGSAAGVMLEKSRVHGILKGTGLSEARIEYVPNEETVAVGERVYTSGDDRVYPKGLLVGTVAAAHPGGEFQQITLRPGARLNRLEEVLVVTEGVHQEVPEGLPRPQAPAALMPAPPPEPGKDLLGLPAPAAVPAGPEGYAPQTDADRLKKRYRELGASQGHVFGEGVPGSKPPDFNLGWSPPGQRGASPGQSAPQPARQPASGPPPSPPAAAPQP